MSPGGGELSLSVCPGVGNRTSSTQMPGGVPGGEMVTGRIEPRITLLELPGLRDAIKKSSIGEGYRESIIYKFFRSRLILRHSSFRVLSFSSQSLCLAFPVVLFRNKFLFSSCGRLAEVRSTHCQVWQKVFQHATSIANRRKIP